MQFRRALAKPLMDKILLSTVRRDAGEKGAPFPRIPGPSPEDKVCIVGAGPAGLHMAVELRRRKYNNIVILEKSDRVGGKCYDVHYQGRVNALGAFLVTKEYFDSFSFSFRQGCWSTILVLCNH